MAGEWLMAVQREMQFDIQNKCSILSTEMSSNDTWQEGTMRIACVLITHLRAKAEMRRHNEERVVRSEERENTFDSSSSESLATNSGSQEPCAQACANAQQMRSQKPSAQTVADAQEMRSQQPSAQPCAGDAQSLVLRLVQMRNRCGRNSLLLRLVHVRRRCGRTSLRP